MTVLNPYPLADVEQDFAYSQGFLENWVEILPENLKTHIKEHINTIINGMKFYRERFTSIQEDLATVRAQYNSLTALTSTYLQTIQQQKEIIDQQLIESQREAHRKDLIET